MPDLETPPGRTVPAPAPAPSRKFVIWAIVLLSLPALLPLAGAVIVPLLNHQVPTGFIEYDLPSYHAEGRAYFDRGFHLTYSNPYAGYNSPAIYFQPHTFLLGLLQQLGLDPGITFNIFGLLALFFGATAAVLFYIEVVGVDTRSKKLALICFFWGGGIFTLWGLSRALFRMHRLSAVWEVEPTYGWWMLNFGRNLVYPTEAFYHGLFLFCLLALVRKRPGLSLALAAVTCLSHPFTGLTLILILIAYSAIELVLRSGAVSIKFLLGAILIAALHLAYYMVWLNRFADHRALQQQWQKAWLYPPKVFIGALILVGCLAIWRLATSRFRPLRDSRARLFAVWFAVVFALTQHNLVIHPIQPIHFAHGYDWMALFFLGGPVLIAILDRILNIPRPLVRSAALALLLGVFLLDNASWLIKTAVSNEYLVYLTQDQSSALTWLSRNLKPGDMVVCQDGLLSYLVSTYTPALSWQGHEHNTPSMDQRHAEVERAFNAGQALPDWRRHGVFYVSPSAWVPPPDLSLTQRYTNSDFSIWSTP
jgi:uncharacterized protein YaiI (UPF0178 family)